MAVSADARIVVIDGHIIAQWHDATGWWTASKANNNNEDDFAVWSESEANMRKAVRLMTAPPFVGDPLIVRTERKPIERHGCWYTSDDDHDAKEYGVALRRLARSLE